MRRYCLDGIAACDGSKSYVPRVQMLVAMPYEMGSEVGEQEVAGGDETLPQACW